MEPRLRGVSGQWSASLAPVLMCLACPLLGMATLDELGLDNPVLVSQAQIDQKLTECQVWLDSLEQEERQATLSPSQQRARALARLYVIFAGPGDKAAGVEAGRLEYVDLATTADPAVSVLRDQVRLPCPPGLVFVRYYTSRHVMPMEILPAFQREHTRGATILSRYIAILEAASSDPAKQRFLRQSQVRILSHELVHAYVNAILGSERKKLPLWFHEGCATYFSGSPGGARVSELIQTPVGFRHVLFQEQAPRDYRQYKLVFAYLRAKLGKRHLYALVRQAIDTRSVQSLLTSVQVHDAEGLSAKAQSWERTRSLTRFGIAGCLLIWLLYTVWRLLPKRPQRIEPVV